MSRFAIPPRLAASGSWLLRALGWLLPIVVALLIAFGIGTASARAVLGERGEARFGRAGAWNLQPSSGGAAVDPYTRARLARTGTVPLATAEGLLLSAVVDDRGRPLDARCRYAVVGPMPPARRWSLWVEPPLGNPARPSAIHSRAVVRDREGAYRIKASRTVRPGNWLALPERGPFSLQLALYDTPVARTGGAGDLRTPALRRLGCDPLPGEAPGANAPGGGASGGQVSGGEVSGGGVSGAPAARGATA